MKHRYKKTIALLFCTLALGSYLFAGGASPRKDGAKDSIAAPAAPTTDADAMRVQGEQRFHANCGRCHAAPQKFPPRMMKTVLRHMRVRATITDEDMRLILSYMTQ
jgi:mono/diheme cytochrome c family protein